MVAEQFNPAGFAVAGVSVRSSTNARFPAQVLDIHAAIRFLRANARRYGLDSRRIGVMGESSGGWTATMAGVTGAGVQAVMINCPLFSAIFGSATATTTRCHRSRGSSAARSRRAPAPLSEPTRSATWASASRRS
jgi:acetyl esterase/lipase